jgi:hypothetical protein
VRLGRSWGEAGRGGSMGISEWLTNEAVSNYVVFIAGVLLGVIGWLIAQRLRRKKPSIIRVQKEFETKLVDIDSKVRDKLEILYNGRHIDGFHQAVFTVNNMGEEPVEDVVISFHLESFEDVDFMEAVLTNPEEIQELEIESFGSETDLGIFTIQLPFLNPRREYEDYLGVTLYAPKPLSVKAVTGKGYGWGTKYVDKNEVMKRISRALIEGTATPFGFLLIRVVDWILRL